MLGIFRSIAAVTYKDLMGTLLRPKSVVSAVVVGLVTVVLAWSLAQSALNAAETEEDSETDSSIPLVLWHRGAEGVLVTLSFGMVPLLLPLVPIIMINDTIQRDRSSRFMETAMSRPVPRWSLALGKCAGVYAAVAIPALSMTLASSLLIQFTLGTGLSLNLVIAFLGSSLFLVALYTCLALLFTTVIAPNGVLSLMLFLWIVFNAISPTAFAVGGQFLLIVPLKEAPLYMASWHDLASFTGLYHGLMSFFVPVHLDFVVRPDILSDWSGLAASWGLVFSGAPILAGLLIGYLYLYVKSEPR